MKKALTILLIGALLLIIAPVFCSASEAGTDTVSVTLCNGTLLLASKDVSLSDADNDGTLTINDALIIAHSKYYDGGADTGYGYANGDWGLYITKLWGNTSGNFGYYVNNASAFSLTDAIKSGDSITAFVYTDVIFWSDTYCYFDKSTVDAVKGEEISLTLYAAGYDENFNPVTYPVSDAVITVNGEKTAYITDKDGRVSLTLNDEGQAVISAVSDSTVLVPPVCKANIETNASTGDMTICITLVGVTLLISLAYLHSFRKQYEK